MLNVQVRGRHIQHRCVLPAEYRLVLIEVMDISRPLLDIKRQSAKR